MEERNMPAILLMRNDTAQSWEDGNPVLHRGEPGLETNTRKLKFGDGQTPWSDLPYITTPTDKFVHSKNGTVHNLTGPAGAEVIYFTATDVYQDGDVWTLNGAPVAVTYHDGQALLPTAVIAGDLAEAVIQGDAVRLMLQKPTPQKNLLINGLFNSAYLVNQQSQDVYDAPGGTIDLWRLYSTASTITLNPSFISMSIGPNTGGISYAFEKLTQYNGYVVTLTCKYRSRSGNPKCYFRCAEGEFWRGIDLINDEVWHVGTVSFTMPDISSDDVFTQVAFYNYDIVNAAELDVEWIKLEPGSRYTGKYIPKPGETLAECQRYFETIDLSGSNLFVPATMRSGSPECHFYIPFKVRKRTIPVFSINTNTGRFVTPEEIRNITSLNVTNASTDGAGIVAVFDYSPSTFTAGWVDSIGVLGFSADL